MYHGQRVSVSCGSSKQVSEVHAVHECTESRNDDGGLLDGGGGVAFWGSDAHEAAVVQEI